MRTGGLGLSILLIGAGAVLTWAVETISDEIDITMVGVVLLITGAIGLIGTFAISASGGRTVVERNSEVVVERDPRRPEV